MKNIFYLIYLHSNCIEGICLNKNNNNFYITKDVSEFKYNKKYNEGEEHKEDEEYEEIDLENNFWIKSLEEFLDNQKWREHPIVFILPTEDIIFRKIKFPFQDKKKVEQALPFELEEELIFELSTTTYCSEVQPLPEQKSEAIVLLIKTGILKNIQKICLERDLLIRNIECSSYALFRSKFLTDHSDESGKNIFQVYLGSDEAFINTIKDGRLDEIKIFPNNISEIIQQNFTYNETSLHTFLKNFSREPDKKTHSETKSKFSDSYLKLKNEIEWLCSQFTLHLRLKNFNSESKIETFGLFGPLIRWDGLIFRRRPFPLPEVEKFAERYENNFKKTDNFEDKIKSEKSSFKKSGENTPSTLHELMHEAKQREASKEKNSELHKKMDVKTSEDNLKKLNSESSLESVNPKSSILSMIQRKHWGILGDLRKNTELLFESHFLSLYYEATPWRIFFKRNKIAVIFSASFLIIIVFSFILQKVTKYKLLENEVINAELLVKTEINRTLPEKSGTKIDEIIQVLNEKILNRKYSIKTSKTFEKREYKNLNFLKNISTILNNDAPFQVDSIELTPERFSISGTIDSYDRLQIFKKKLEEIDQFFGKKILESNRKSPNGIIYRILIELN